MSKDESAVVLFYSTSHAVRAERLLKKASIACAMIPVPRHLSSDCGACIRFARDRREEVAGILNVNRIDFEGPVDI